MKKIRWALLMALLLLPTGCAALGLGRSDAQTVEKLEKTAPEKGWPIPQPVEEVKAEPTDEEFVRVVDYIPDVEVDLRYAVEDNFMGKAVYSFSDAWLRYGTVKKLAAAQEMLKAQGYRLKIWDAFRPPAAQFVMWEVYPVSGFVANPHKGFSNHSRGNTVDVTLVTLAGEAVVMPTAFDDFSPKADRDYSDVEPEGAQNAILMETIMEQAGFVPYSGEWWHFADSVKYDVEQEFIPET